MHAMILAAGRGSRMRHLTENCPKPLLPLQGKALIEHQIEALVARGFTELVINLGYQGEQIRQAVGFGSRFGARIVYSIEGEHILETGGGICRALPLLSEQFVVVNADVYSNYPYGMLRSVSLGPEHVAHVVLVPNPAHHQQGDFAIDDRQRLVAPESGSSYTFSGIGVYHHDLFNGFAAGERFPLAQALKQAMAQGRVSAEYAQHVTWSDIGTPERLAGWNHDNHTMDH